MPDEPVLGRLAELAAGRHGVVAAAEARRLGLTEAQVRTLLRRGAWVRPVRGVLVHRAAPATWRQRCAVVSLAADGALSHVTAARLHGLDGCRSEDVHVSVVAPRQPRRLPGTIHRVADLGPSDVVRVDGLRCTSIARTLCDLGAVVHDDVVEQALDDALRRGVSLRWVESTLERLHRPGPSGTGALVRVLERPDRSGRLPDSRFERLVQRTVRGLGLPEPDRQVQVRDGSGTLVAVVDLGWPSIRLGIEAHSDRWHSGARRGRADQRRDNRLAALGWELLYASWEHVHRPAEFVELVGDAFRARSQFLSSGGS